MTRPRAEGANLVSDEPCTPITERLLELAVEHRPEVSVVHAAGEIDLCTAPRLAETLAGQPGPVVLDLSRVGFLSAAGVQVVLDVCARGCQLCLVAPRGTQVCRVLDLTGVTAVVSRFEELADALGA
ncbi:STAS domain-containing protein [Amycolatopsis viridis]|uniref:Anti-anti-sigma factor n=1 Tax=Amycolatopsis viridis TaxID=185678 RepID=A0ABX0T368_9PSEU|nr:STAS domain-containing protein [Amycolatopsis viridis]NIH81995.1 anti-anti-sigma factor [Amycolatopsis viridis]